VRTCKKGPFIPNKHWGRGRLCSTSVWLVGWVRICFLTVNAKQSIPRPVLFSLPQIEPKQIEALCDGIDFSATVTRAKFEEINSDLFKKTLRPVEQVLRDSGLEKNEVWCFSLPPSLPPSIYLRLVLCLISRQRAHASSLFCFIKPSSTI
jgi:hypothetical protein